MKEGTDQGLSVPETMYSVGWIFHDLFERASHDERKGVNVTVASLDKYAADLPEQKIVRDIAEAQQSFGRAAAAFMDEETQNRIKEALDTSILKEIRSYTGSLKTFVLNVSAGVVSGILFAAILILIGRIYQNDPSPIQVGNLLLNGGQSDHVAKPVADPHPAPPPPK